MKFWRIFDHRKVAGLLKISYEMKPSSVTMLPNCKPSIVINLAIFLGSNSKRSQ